jgi:uncharacterized integral membrane protein
MDTPQSTDRQTTATRPRSRAPSRRQVAAAIIAVVVAVFALVNLNDVKVHWVLGTYQTPLIVVIVLAFLLGIALDRLVLMRAKRKRPSES